MFAKNKKRNISWKINLIDVEYTLTIIKFYSTLPTGRIDFSELEGTWQQYFVHA